MFDPNSILVDPKFRKDRLTLEAAWRFQMVAPLLDRTLSKLTRKGILARLLAKPQEHPWRGPVKLSARSLRRWCASFSKDRLPGLMAKRRNDTGLARLMPAEALLEAQRLLEEDPRRTVAGLMELMLQGNPEWGDRLARSTLDRHLRRVGKPKRDNPEAYLKFEAADPNDLWQGDILHGSLAVHEGKEVKAKWVCWLDDHSRHILDLQAFPDERFPVIEASLKRAILKHGRPSRILVDNGKVYSGRSFTLACSQLGIHKMHSAPYHPQSKGKVEKFFQLLRRRFLNEIENLPPLPLERLNRLAAGWVDSYHDRPHKSLENAGFTSSSPRYATPRERYQPRFHRPVTLQVLEESFWQWDIRTISPQGKIEFFGGHYFTDLSLVGQKVIIRYDPCDLSRLILWRDGQKLTEATATQLLHKTKPRRNLPASKKASDASERFLQSLEKAQQERIERELNLIELPSEEGDAHE